MSSPEENYRQSLLQRRPKFVLGIDEVGYGSWAGPLVVGAVLAPVDWTHPLLRDSKEVKTEAGRVGVLAALKESPAARYWLHWTSSEDIDRSGVFKARLHAMKSVCDCLALVEENVLIIIDGNVRVLGHDHATFPKADSVVPQVMAAAMTAKVARDNYMIACAKQFPQYGFERHKGYGGGREHQHTIALKKYGPCPLHRRSYEIKAFASST